MADALGEIKRSQMSTEEVFKGPETVKRPFGNIPESHKAANDAGSFDSVLVLTSP